MNAIIHRDYFLGNAPIKFYEYKRERIEIANPGGLFGRVNPENFPFVNDYRNPLLAEAMKVLGFVNKYNRGIAKVNRELEQAGNRPAQFDVNKKTEFRVTIIAKSFEGGQINPESGRIKNVRSYDIKSQDDAVLCAIQDCPGIKADGIFLQIRTSTRSVRRSLERLSGASKIEYRGSKRTGGWYVRT